MQHQVAVQMAPKCRNRCLPLARSTPGLRLSVQGIATAWQRAANARAFRERVRQEQGLDVGPCRVMAPVYNEDRARPRNIGRQHIGGRANGGAGGERRGGVAEAFGAAWLEAYGMDEADAPPSPMWWERSA